MDTNQRGFALATSMVFLVVLSIAGVTAMRSSTLEHNMSSNMQDQNHAFQLAETAIANTTKDARVLDTGSVDEENGRVEFHYSSVYSETLNAWSYYRGEGVPKGETMGEVNSLNTTSLHVFHIRTVARYNNSVSTHAQGLTIVGPKTN